MTDHLTQAEVQGWIDGRADGQLESRCADHVQICPACREVVREYTAIHGTLRRIPHETAGDYFTSRVLGALHERVGKGIALRAIDMLAYTFAMVCVCGIIVAVFSLAGVIDPSGGWGGALTSRSDAVRPVADGLSGAYRTFGSWVSSQSALLSGSTVAKPAVLTVLVVVVLGACDRVFGRRLAGRV